MKVKVGDHIHDSEVEPIMVIFSETDKTNIGSMAPDASRYCAFPDTMDDESVRRWMSEEERR